VRGDLPVAAELRVVVARAEHLQEAPERQVEDEHDDRRAVGGLGAPEEAAEADLAEQRPVAQRRALLRRPLADRAVDEPRREGLFFRVEELVALGVLRVEADGARAEDRAVAGRLAPLQRVGVEPRRAVLRPEAAALAALRRPPRGVVPAPAELERRHERVAVLAAGLRRPQRAPARVDQRRLAHARRPQEQKVDVALLALRSELARPQLAPRRRAERVRAPARRRGVGRGGGGGRRCGVVVVDLAGGRRRRRRRRVAAIVVVPGQGDGDVVRRRGCLRAALHRAPKVLSESTMGCISMGCSPRR
jgi:hypothetical protein